MYGRLKARRVTTKFAFIWMLSFSGCSESFPKLQRQIKSVAAQIVVYLATATVFLTVDSTYFKARHENSARQLFEITLFKRLFKQFTKYFCDDTFTAPVFAGYQHKTNSLDIREENNGFARGRRSGEFHSIKIASGKTRKTINIDLRQHYNFSRTLSKDGYSRKKLQ
uniref:Uncharacterized protein n=1 Tax=Glossina pallidipes TaxID=7398 RepID=A0A1B0A8F7_GLOPL